MDKMKKMRFYDWIAYVLLVIAGVNYSLIALFDFNIFERIISLFFESYTVTFAYIKTVVYLIVGLSAVYVGYKLINT